LLAAYDDLRKASGGAAVKPAPNEGETGPPPDQPVGGLDGHEVMLATLPREFALYARGAAAYRLGDRPAAVRHWQTLLALPKAERHYRSTWAAFMIGKALFAGDAAESPPWFAKTRRLARDGFADSLHLAPSSHAWQARAEIRMGQRPAAMRRYFELFRTADEPERTVAYTSLCWMGRRAFDPKEPHDSEYVGDPVCRRIVTAWVLSRRDPRRECVGWLEAIEKAGPAATEGTGRLAWAAYRAGRMDLARRWARVAGDKAPYARWVRSKLLLRDGKIDEAVALLRGLVSAFPAEDQWIDWSADLRLTAPQSNVRAELGVLMLGRRDFVTALDMLLRSGYWEDAMYVAERVLTIDELTRYVNRHAADPELTGRLATTPDMKDEGANRLPYVRNLLARRLARAGRWAEALPLYAADTREDARRYQALLAEGRDAKRSARERAESLFRAARLGRRRGHRIIGADLDPDWMIHGGRFDFESAASVRALRLARALADHFAQGTPPPALLAALGPTDDEQQRARSSAPQPTKRYHYRYVAANLMWDCAALLPDNDPLLARALWEGGTWIKNRDPQAADRFYKALVLRCRKLPVSAEADRKRWFPAEGPPSPEGFAP
ncbi:MAG: hypothetical protein GWP05_06345, partial [Anaerolineaceae bacterium]|nr:hypothetical protein [Anaerolineaceae bacterium]